MRILITGGSGFLGTNVIEALRSGNYGDHELLSLDIVPPQRSDHQPYWRYTDVRELRMFRKEALRFDPDVLIHLAARTDLSESSNIRGYSTNIDGVENAIAVANCLPGLKNVVYASSRLVFDVGYEPKSKNDYAPSTLYGCSKALGEVLVRTQPETDVPWLIVRPTSIWGPWFGVPYRDFFHSVALGRYVHPRGIRPLKQFGYVGNAVHQLLGLALASDTSESAGGTFWLADYQALDVLEWAREIRDQLGLSSTREVDLRVLRGVAQAGDLWQRATGRNAPLTSFRLANLCAGMTYDTNATEVAVGALPFSTREGIHLTLSWMQQRGLLPKSSAEVQP